MKEERYFKISEVSEHNSILDCWLIIDGRVLDVTKFSNEHPGGEEILIESGGKDATKEFEAIGHSKHAKKMLLKYQVGFLRGSKLDSPIDDDDDDDDDDNDKEFNTKEMKAFVIKENPMTKFAGFVEFFVPLLASFLYLLLAYIYM